MSAPMSPRLLLAGSSRICTRSAPKTTPATTATATGSLNSLRHASGARPEAPTSASKRRTLRRQMDEWLQGPGAAFKTNPSKGPNYLTMYDMNGIPLHGSAASASPSQASPAAATDTPTPAPDQETPANDESADQATTQQTRAPPGNLRPFPLNPAFVSQSILSEELRNEIYRCVKVQKMDLRAVSIMYSIDTRRVAAVVRLVEVEQKMKRDNEPLAIPYAKAVHKMVPVTPLAKAPEPPVPHESINDLPVHPLTNPQIFWPVSESRQFTRVDAGRVFSAAPEMTTEDVAKLRSSPHNSPDALQATMLRREREVEQVGKPPMDAASSRRVHRRRWVIPGPQPVLQAADVRLPHPYLVGYHYERAQYNSSNLRDVNRRFEQRLREVQRRDSARKADAQKAADKRVTRVADERGRFEFWFKDVQATRESVGLDGRGNDAPGERYGVPSSDRKRGTRKIPKKVVV